MIARKGLSIAVAVVPLPAYVNGLARVAQTILELGDMDVLLLAGTYCAKAKAPAASSSTSSSSSSDSKQPQPQKKNKPKKKKKGAAEEATVAVAAAAATTTATATAAALGRPSGARRRAHALPPTQPPHLRRPLLALRRW